jgi:hypothetical protein
MTQPLNSTEGEQGVTANPLDPGPGDWPVEAAQSGMRSAMFNHPEVIEHLLVLADLREQRQASPNRGRWRKASCGGEPVLVEASLVEQMRYRRELEASPLCDLVTVDYLNHRVAVVRERLDASRQHEVNLWGDLIPRGQKGADYGRQRGAYPSMDSETIKLAVADLVRRLQPDPDRAKIEAEAIWLSCPRCSALPGEDCDGPAMHAARLAAGSAAAAVGDVSSSTVRQVRRRLRQLAIS